MGLETENYEIAFKGFENTRSWFAFSFIETSSEVSPVGYLKGQYKSESSLMTCEAELHGCVSRMARPMVLLMCSRQHWPMPRTRSGESQRRKGFAEGVVASDGFSKTTALWEPV